MTEFPVDDTLHPVSFHAEAIPKRTPTALLVLIAFLLADSAERWVEVGWHLWNHWSAGTALSDNASSWHPWLPTAVLFATVEGSIATLLWARTPWCRWLCVLILLLHLFYLGHVLTVTNPGLWLYMTPLGRIRVLVSAAVDALAIAWLCSSHARTYLEDAQLAGP